jgi:hypothetical protein
MLPLFSLQMLITGTVTHLRIKETEFERQSTVAVSQYGQIDIQNLDSVDKKFRPQNL